MKSGVCINDIDEYVLCTDVEIVSNLMEFIESNKSFFVLFAFVQCGFKLYITQTIALFCIQSQINVFSPFLSFVN